MAVNEARLNAFLGNAVGDLGAAIGAVLILLGDELGLYRALAPGPLTSAELANRTGTQERYIREWLAAGQLTSVAGTAQARFLWLKHFRIPNSWVLTITLPRSRPHADGPLMPA